MKLENKVAIVTGAARGIGRAFALRLAKLGCHVVVTDIKLNGAIDYGEVLTADSVAAEIEAMGRRSIEFEADLTNREQVESLIQNAISIFGQIDILVNNAGGALTPIATSSASQMREQDLRTMLDVNLMTAVNCSQAAAPFMRERGTGNIINVASTMGLDAAHRRGLLADYGISKTAVVQLTRFLAIELGPSGIRVNCIAPGSTATARVVHQAVERGIVNDQDLPRIPLRRLGTVEDMAGTLEFLATDLSAYVTGQCISVCGGKVLTAS